MLPAASARKLDLDFGPMNRMEGTQESVEQVSFELSSEGEDGLGEEGNEVEENAPERELCAKRRRTNCLE